MNDTHNRPEKQSLLRSLLLTWAVNVGYFLILRVTLSFLHDPIIRTVGVGGAGIIGLMVPLSAALFSTFLIPRWLVNRFVACCVFSFPVPSLLCAGSTFLIPYGIPNREVYVFQVITLGLLCSFVGTMMEWFIRRRK